MARHLEDRKYASSSLGEERTDNKVVNREDHRAPKVVATTVAIRSVLTVTNMDIGLVTVQRKEIQANVIIVENLDISQNSVPIKAEVVVAAVVVVHLVLILDLARALSHEAEAEVEIEAGQDQGGRDLVPESVHVMAVALMTIGENGNQKKMASRTRHRHRHHRRHLHHHQPLLLLQLLLLAPRPLPHLPLKPSVRELGGKIFLFVFVPCYSCYIVLLFCYCY